MDPGRRVLTTLTIFTILSWQVIRTSAINYRCTVKDREEGNGTRKGSRIVINAVKRRWPNGVVPYTIEEGTFNQEMKDLIQAAIKDIHDNTCVRWRPKESGDHDFVHIIQTGATGCNADLGYYGPKKAFEGYQAKGLAVGEHRLNLQAGNCNQKGVIVHEMLHNLGFGHEQVRPDRDTILEMKWENILLDKAAQYWRTTWARNKENLPQCTTDGKSQGASFDNCIDGDPVEDFGVPYDPKSIMHYQPSFFTVDENDESKPAFVAKPGSSAAGLGARDFGGNDLTQNDILRIKRAYGCESCGGHFESPTGGALNGGSDDAKSPCEYLLETDSGKGIEIDISSMSGDCSTTYLEVRLGRTKEGQMVGTKHCASSGKIKIKGNMVWLKWIRPEAEAASSSLKATWKTFEFSCCSKLKLENLDGNLATAEVFTKTDTDYNGRGLYKMETQDKYLYFESLTSGKGWHVGGNPNNGFSGLIASVQDLSFCPEDAVNTWDKFDGGWKPDQDAKIRCSKDCAQHPSQPECAVCCDELAMKSTFVEFTDTGKFYSQVYGNWKNENNEQHNGHKLYKSVKNSDWCLFLQIKEGYTSHLKWMVDKCSSKGAGGGYFTASSWEKCPHQTSNWNVYSQDSGKTVQTDLSFPCDGGNPTFPTVKTEAPKTEAPKTEAPKTEAPKTKAPKTDAPKMTTPGTDKTGTSVSPKTDATGPTKPSGVCPKCKNIKEGPKELQGNYDLVEDDDTPLPPTCKDKCVYKKDGILYCFAAGGYTINTC